MADESEQEAPAAAWPSRPVYEEDPDEVEREMAERYMRLND